jgi:hypothetical protein
MSVTSCKTPSDFPAQFRRHVIPQVEQAIPRGVHILLHDDDCTYGAIVAEIWRYCWQRGAGYLSDHLQSQLRDHIHDLLTEEIVRQDTATSKLPLAKQAPKRVSHDCVTPLAEVQRCGTL